MESKLKNISTSYHTFEENQVLTAKQLNELPDYFDDQDRLSRVSLTGTGIVCGFKIALTVTSSKTTVTVTQGTGITTDGDLIKLQTGKNAGLKNLAIDEMIFTHFRKFEDKEAVYPMFRKKDEEILGNPEKLMDLWELLPEKTEDAGVLKDLPDIQNKVAMLYLESYSKPADLCTATDCDNQGIEQVNNLRVLLISEADAKIITGEKDTIYNKHNVYETWFALPQVAVKRPVLAGKNVASVQFIKNIFFDTIKNTNTLKNLKTGTDKLLGWFGKSPVSAVIDDIFNFTQVTVPADFQYRYGLLKDICDTYNEIRRLFLFVNVQCSPDIASFPKHLLLGFVSENKKNYPDLRHRFYKSQATGTEFRNLQQIKFLIDRIIIQLNGFLKFSNGNEIKITPSQPTGYLGDKAIPFYYNPAVGIRKNWNFNFAEMLQPELAIGYRFGATANPLLFETQPVGFYRIEGHQGKDLNAVIASVSQQIALNGLDFDFVYFNLDSGDNRFQALVNNAPSVEHLSGVAKGGTFIIVASGNKVVADFSLSYRLQDEADLHCCRLMECSYPWISTLKYLNNLSRGLGGTVSRKLPVRKNYVLQILDYRINDTKLINGIVTITIPVKKILQRRMHAVTEALNMRFPEGVVFDFNEGQKRLLITYGMNDKFLFRLKDVTESNEKPIYEYSNSGLLKNNKVLRTDAVICREIIRYNSKFYRRLQTEFAPVNKDDDYSTFDNKWAEWEKLVKELKKKYPSRVVRTIDQLPADIRKLAAEIKSKLVRLTATQQVNVMLDGDWVNGSWVDTAMLDYYRVNRQNAADPVVKFINLRKLLHSETGVTKLSVYITNQPYSAVYDLVINEFAQSADFYFTAPTGKNAKAL